MAGTFHTDAPRKTRLEADGREGILWVGSESKAPKTLHWARAIDGQRTELMAWLRAQGAGKGAREQIIT